MFNPSASERLYCAVITQHGQRASLAGRATQLYRVASGPIFRVQCRRSCLRYWRVLSHPARLLADTLARAMAQALDTHRTHIVSQHMLPFEIYTAANI